jgi:hypothetical protein
MSKVPKGRITKRRKLQNVEKGRKLQKAEKRKKNTVQYRKNPWKIFFPENKKGSEKFPWVFSSSKQCKKNKMLKITNIQHWEQCRRRPRPCQ